MMSDEKDQQNSDERSNPLDVIGSDSVMEVVPMVSSQRVDDAVLWKFQSLSLGLFGAPSPFEAYRLSTPTTVTSPGQDSTDYASGESTNSLRCSTKSTVHHNLGQSATTNGCFLEEERFVEIINPSTDEKLELTPQCIQMTQPATSSLPDADAFSNEGNIMQLDSSETQSFDEFDTTNTGGKVVSADKSCNPIFHLEKKNTIGTGKRKCGIAEDEHGLEDLQQHFHQIRLDAVKSLGVNVSTLKCIRRKHGVSTLKRIYRKHGVSRWPYRNKKNGSNYKGQLHRQNRFHLQMPDEGIVTIMATYGEHTVIVPPSATSGIVELKKELAKRLELAPDSFHVKYLDEDLDLILIACDAALHECLTSSTSRSNQVIRLLILDKVVNSKKCKVAEH